MKAQVKAIGARLGADKTKVAVFVGLVAMGMLLWGRLLLLHVPREAVATPVAVALPDPSALPGRRVVAVDLPTELSRDVFSLDSNHYSRVPKTAAPAAPQAVEKSVDESADEQARISAIRRQAAALQLRTTVQGAKPQAMIDGQMVSQGQTIKGFLLKRVETRQVVVEKDGVEVVLEM